MKSAQLQNIRKFLSPSLRKKQAIIKEKKNELVQDVITDIGKILNQTTGLLEDHEKRLQQLESTELRKDLKDLEGQINEIQDAEKKAQAIKAFKGMCELLGILDLEAN